MNYVIEVYDVYSNTWLPVDFADTAANAITCCWRFRERERSNKFRVRPYSTSYKRV